MQYRLAPAPEEDQQWLDALRRSAYLELVVATWEAWDEERPPRHFVAFGKRGGIHTVEVESERVGMIQLIGQDDGIGIGEIQVQPSGQNRGIGTR